MNQSLIQSLVDGIREERSVDHILQVRTSIGKVVQEFDTQDKLDVWMSQQETKFPGYTKNLQVWEKVTIVESRRID